MRQLGTTSGVLAGSAFLRLAWGEGSVSQIQLTGWTPEGHDARVRAWGERLWERAASALGQITVHVRTTMTIIHTASRIEAHGKTGADLSPMGDRPSTSATSRFKVIQYSGARWSARE